MFKPKYFSSCELVPPLLHRHYGDRCFLFFDVYALLTLDALRSRYGPIVVNSWRWGGGFVNSGFRLFDETEGAPLSQHKFGRAFDCKFKRTTVDEVYADMESLGCFDSKRQTPPPFDKIHRVQYIEGISYLHFDRYPIIPSDRIKVFKPHKELLN